MTSFGRRRSLSGHPCPPRSWALLAVGLPARAKRVPDLDGVSAFRTRELRPGWAPSLPRARRCSSRSGVAAQPAPAASQRPVLAPRIQHPILRGSALRGINEGSSNSPVRPFPSPAAARMKRAAASAFPRASHPADQEPTTHVEVGTGHRARTWNYALNITFESILQSVVHSQRATSRRTRRYGSGCGRRSTHRNRSLRLSARDRAKCSVGQT